RAEGVWLPGFAPILAEAGVELSLATFQPKMCYLVRNLVNQDDGLSTILIDGWFLFRPCFERAKRQDLAIDFAGLAVEANEMTPVFPDEQRSRLRRRSLSGEACADFRAQGAGKLYLGHKIAFNLLKNARAAGVAPTQPVGGAGNFDGDFGA